MASSALSVLPSRSRYLRYFAGAFVVVALATALTMFTLVAHSTGRPGWVATSAWHAFVVGLLPFSLPSTWIAMGLQSWFGLPGGGWALLLTMGVGVALTAAFWAAVATLVVEGGRRLLRGRPAADASVPSSPARRSANRLPPPDPNALDLLAPFSAVLLDMNGTFMFGHDRFGAGHDVAATYRDLGGGLSGERVRAVVDACYRYLAERYTDPAYYDAFPTVAEALRVLPEARGLGEDELARIERVFAAHELGRVPPAYALALRRLAGSHRLALVTDVWSARQPWLSELARAGVLPLFDALVFSSDIGSVKPSPRPFRLAIERLEADLADCVVVGDSARRDVGGALASGLAAVWIGKGAAPEGVRGVVSDLRDLVAREA